MTVEKPSDRAELHDWGRRLVEDGIAARRGHETIWWENIAAYVGDLWTEFNPHSGRLEEPAKPDHKVRLAINLNQPIIRTEYAKILKNRPIIDCVAASDNQPDLNSAEVGDDILNGYVEKQFVMPRIRREAVMWCLLTGMGGIFTDYDETANAAVEVPLAPDGTPISDPAAIKAVQKYYRSKRRRPKTGKIFIGELRFKAFSPWQLIWDFAVNDPHEAGWGIITEVYDVLEVERRWGVEIEPDRNVKPNTLESRLLNRVDLTKTLDLTTQQGQDLAQVHRLFVRPGHPYFPDGAEVVFTESDLIKVKKFPFAHGQLPYAVMGHVPLPSSRYPMSVLTQTKDPVLELSKTESQLVENRNLMANPPWIEYDAHNLPDDAIQNKPGLRIKVQWRPGIPPPAPVQMPDMPGYVQNLPELFKQHVLEISGQGETSQGRVPAGARSGVAIAYLQEEDDTKLGPTIQEFEEMMERWAYQTLKVIAEKYVVPRTIQLAGAQGGEPKVFDFMGTMLFGVAGVEVQAGSALPRSKAAKQQFMFDLWDRGIVQDPRELMQMLELTQGEPLDWEVDIQQADRENIRLAAGEPQPVEEWYNHKAHINRHQRYMKSADWEALSDQRKQIFRDHLDLHKKLDQDQQLQQAALSMVTGGGQGMNGAPQMANGMNNQAPAEGGPYANQEAPPPLTAAEPQ